MAKKIAPKTKSTSKPKTTPAPVIQVKGSVQDLSAEAFIKKLKTMTSATELKKIQGYFKSGEGQYAEGDIFIGVRMGQVFDLAKEFMDMDPIEIEKLLESPIHEARTGAVSIMDFQVRQKKTPESRKKELFDLYLRRHDRINNWDLVDRAAIHVIGAYLADKPRKVLYKLAKSKNIWERRTAIVSTAYFLKTNDTSDTFKIAELLVKDDEDLIHKAVGGWIRQAGKSDPSALLAFLDKYASVMPRTMLRYSIEHLDAKKKKHYLGLKDKK
jgi:3-methyladenine DNA glycosylase AlkD